MSPFKVISILTAGTKISFLNRTRRTFGDQQNVLAVHDDFIALIENLARFDDPAGVRASGIVLLVFHGYLRPQSVADENRFDETQLVESVGECHGIDSASGEANADGEDHSSVGNTLAELRLSRKLRVDMMRKKVAGMPGVDDDICFCDRAPRSQALCPDHIVFEIFCAIQASSRPRSTIFCRQ